MGTSTRLPTDLAPLPGGLTGSTYALLNVVGSGAAFPFSFSGTGGTSSVNIATGLAKINMSIHMILSTRKGERVLRPTFGCFTGDTLVPLLSGEVVPISSLVGRRVDLYGCDLKGVITATESPGAVSRGVRKVVAVALDNGSVIRCTPDHLFLCRDGVYREASSLTEGTSLMPLYRHITKKGYEMVYIPSLNRRVAAHRLTAPGTPPPLASRPVVHHKDFNRLNNAPSNLVWMTWDDHQNLHSQHGTEVANRLWEEGGAWQKMWTDEEHKEWREKTIEQRALKIAEHNRRYKEDPEYRQRSKEKRAATAASTGNASAALQARWDSTTAEERVAFGEKISRTKQSLSTEEKEKQSKNRRKAKLEYDKSHPEEAAKNRLRMAELGKKVGSRVGTEYGRHNFAKWYTSEEGLAHVTALGKSHRKNVDADEILSFAQTVSVSSREALYQAVEQHFGVSRGLIKSRVKLSDLGRVGPNHKVSFVSFAGEEEVFDLVDSTTGNYALDAGVFVHNSDVAKLLFNPNDQATWDRLKFEVADAISAWEKRIQITQISAITGVALSPTLLQSIPGLTQQVASDLQSPNAMGIVIQYNILRTNVAGSYVYPYSLNGDPLSDNLNLRFNG